MRYLFTVPTVLLTIVLLARVGAAADAQPEKLNGPRIITNSRGMKLAAVAEGQFSMGSADAHAEVNQDETPQHQVTITQPFYMGVYEVTQAEYEQVMGTNPSYFSSQGKGSAEVVGLETDRFPVERVKANEAIDFFQKLSELPDEKAAGRVYRLPTEAEWEYACGAGTTTAFHGGDRLLSVILFPDRRPATSEET